MEKGKEYRVGNFVCQRTDVGGIDYINIMSLQGLWGMSISVHTYMGGILESMLDDLGQYEQGVHALLVNFLSTTSIIDANFQKAITEVVSTYVQNVEAVPVDEKEDAKTVEGEKALHEMKKMAEKGEGDGED